MSSDSNGITAWKAFKREEYERVCSWCRQLRRYLKRKSRKEVRAWPRDDLVMTLTTFGGGGGNGAYVRTEGFSLRLRSISWSSHI